jgi:hypothetical protein
VTGDASGFRSKDQVLFDLAKALGFSPDSLAVNRQGRLSPQQFSQYIGRCLKPLGMAVFFAALPFVFWAGMTGMRQHISFPAALDMFVGQLMHLGQMLEDQGKISTLATVLSVLGGIGMGAYNLSRFSPGMYFDLLAREVVTREGRVTAREEQTMRPNGRDPIEKYFFDVKTDRFDVNLAAYRALESGAMYLIYVLPRSGQLVSMEPKVTRADRATDSPAPAPEINPPSPVST